MDSAWWSSRGLLAELPEQKLLGERDTLEFQQLEVGLHPAVERESNLPRPRVHLGVFDRRFVHQVVRAGRRVALDDVERIGVKVSGTVEPRFFTLTGDVHDQRVAVPAPA